MAANRRTLLDNYGRERGAILVGGQPSRSRCRSTDQYRYLRTYPQGQLYCARDRLLLLLGAARPTVSRTPPTTCSPVTPTRSSTGGSTDLITGRKTAGRDASS